MLSDYTAVRILLAFIPTILGVLAVLLVLKHYREQCKSDSSVVLIPSEDEGPDRPRAENQTRSDGGSNSADH